MKAIDREKDNLKIYPQHGIHILRKYIPKSLVKRYGTDRLWKVDLFGFWRLIYTITGDEVKIIAFILEFMDHKKYNKLFGYKKNSLFMNFYKFFVIIRHLFLLLEIHR